MSATPDPVTPTEPREPPADGFCPTCCALDDDACLDPHGRVVRTHKRRRPLPGVIVTTTPPTPAERVGTDYEAIAQLIESKRVTAMNSLDWQSPAYNRGLNDAAALVRGLSDARPTPDPRVWRSGTPNPGPATPSPTERPEWAEGQRAAAVESAARAIAVAANGDACFDERYEDDGSTSDAEDRDYFRRLAAAAVPVGHVVIDPAEARAEFWRVFWRRFDREKTLDWAIDGSRDALEAAIQAGGLAGEKHGRGR